MTQRYHCLQCGAHYHCSGVPEGYPLLCGICDIPVWPEAWICDRYVLIVEED